MRNRSFCVEISISTGIHAHPNGYSAQIYQHSGKTKIIYSDWLCKGMTLEETRNVIMRNFIGRVRSVWISYKKPLEMPGEMMDTSGTTG